MDNGLSYQKTLNRLNLPEPAELVSGQRRIHRAMSVLPDAHRIVLVLVYFYGYGLSDVATLLRVTPWTVQIWQLDGLRGLGTVL